MLLAALFLTFQVQPPKTVNGDSLGDAKDFATSGPATVCIRNMALRVETGEMAYLGYAGIHSGSLRLVTGGRTVEYSHGEIFAKPKGSLRFIEDQAGVRVYKSNRRGNRYAVFVPGYKDALQKGPLVWISGSALNGHDGDLRLLRRISFAMDTPPGCDRTYTYGWSMLFGDEPLSRKKDQ